MEHITSTQAPVAPFRILILDGHPREDSFCAALASHFHRGAAHRDHQIRHIALRDLGFSPIAVGQALEPDLLRAQQDLLWAEHIVFVYPTWWGTVPALLKGFLDRVLLPGWAFEEREGGGWRGLLGGRSACLITTMDTPRWVYRWVLGAPGTRAVRDATLGFCGIHPVRVIAFGPVRPSTLEQRCRWLRSVENEGRHAARRFRDGWRPALAAWVAAARLRFYPLPWIAYTAGAVAGALALSRPLNAGVFWTAATALVLLQFITVLTNELCDFRSDQVNRHAGPFTGGSRVLVDRRLSAAALRRGRFGALILFLLAAATLIGALPVQRVAVGALLGAGLVLGIGYSAPPLKLASRGLGELNVALTHSAFVILLGYVSQGGNLADAAPWNVALPLFCGVLPAIILAGFPDQEADRATEKKTLAVRLGRPAAAVVALVAVVAAAGLALVIPSVAAPTRAAGAIGCFMVAHAALLVVLIGRFLHRQSPSGRIDGLLVVSLTYMIWFAAVPLWGFWSQLHGGRD